MNPIITLLTDFGLEDSYVGVMKGVILGINPEARTVDLCHGVRAGDIKQAAFILLTSYNFFPQGTIHLVVVDPGVGTARLPILVGCAGYYFVAPDNGVLSYVVEGEDYQAFKLDKPNYWLKEISRTFHGRDIFAPVAAFLSKGIPPSELGSPLNSIYTFPFPKARSEEGVIYGEVIYIDRFGNLVTNISGKDLVGRKPIIEVKGYRIEGLSSSYAEGREVLALVDSFGFLEIAICRGSAHKRLGIDIGYPIKVSLQKEVGHGLGNEK